MKLFICEKPAQARDIAKHTGASQKEDTCLSGPDIKVTWCLGHLLEQEPPEAYCADLKPWRMAVLPVIPTQWKLKPVDRTRKQLYAIQGYLKQATEVVIATDADREGDVIGREVLEFFHYTGKVSRLWLSALDDTSIKKALNDIRPGESTYPLYLAGLGRQRADWLVGMNSTMAATCLFQRGTGSLSLGRVQTPTLNLVVMRDREIEHFQPKNYYVLKAQFKAATSFWATWQPKEHLTDEEHRLLNKPLMDALIEKIKAGTKTGEVLEFTQSHKKTSAPVCFSLSSLQKTASSKFGFSAKDTLAIAQSLYETHKATTYPRTDTGYLPESQFQESPEILNALASINPNFTPLLQKTNPNFKSPIWDDNKVTAHHGIIPTLNKNVNLSAMSANEQKLYDLICRYYIAQFLGDYEYSNRKTKILCHDEAFTASSNTPLNPGWKAALGHPEEDEQKEETDTEESLLPELTLKQVLPLQGLNPQTKQTKPPCRYTEGTLIDAMKNISRYVNEQDYRKLLKDTAGIGTEATRASIIEKLFTREYLQLNGKQVISTEKGRQIIDLTPPMLKDPVTTAKWEEMLDHIAKGHETLDKFTTAQTILLKDILKAFESEASQNKHIGASIHYPCPLCDKHLLRRKGQYGYFWSCQAHPACKGSMKDLNGKPVAKTESTATNTPCPTCQTGHLVKKQGKKVFWGCSTYPHCDAIFWNEPKPNGV